MKKHGTLAVNTILFTINALLWGGHLIVDLTYGMTDAPLMILHGLCTLIWGFGAVVWYRRWKKQRSEEPDDNA